MKISDYSYELPEELIALVPPKVRGTTRLLVLNRSTGTIEHRNYGDVFEYLGPGDVVILNNTKVIKARLLAKNNKGQERELLLLEEHAGSDSHTRRVMYRGKLHTGEVLAVGKVEVTVEEIHDGGIAVLSSSANLLELASDVGSVPLPPYMHRNANESDTERYQTVFAEKAGSVAAPTASLNFTRELEKKILDRGAVIAYLTLHVGLGTFLPIRADDIEDHVMHSEYFEIPETTVRIIAKAKAEGRKILAVGTTVARTLEFAAAKILNAKGPVAGEANIFIYPGYEFKLVNMLLTNFHAPKSTVLMLASGFAGWDNLRNAYEVAIEEKYAFLSYGDSMLIF
jgi:S-adenosylmethionine:tRNA ribosyltransferase-isomerase